MSRSISVLYKAKHSLDYKSLHILYCALILPYLNYCVEVWGSYFKSSLHSLIILQKRSIRIIHKVGYQDHTNTLLLKSKLLKFKDLVNLQTAQIIFKAKNNSLPANVQRVFCDLVNLQTAQIIFKAKNNSLPANVQRVFCDRDGGEVFVFQFVV